MGRDCRETLGGIVGKVIDPKTPVDQELAALLPKEIIAVYYRGVDQGDQTRIFACWSMHFLKRVLFANIDNRYLYNRD